jgi:hypothetical protein
MDHIGILDRYEIKDEPWTKEVNLVFWNGRPAKIDIRDWNSTHDRMSKGITLTEEQALTMVRLLANRYRYKATPSSL